MQVRSPGYPFRPEIVESAYCLFHCAGNARYRCMGKEFFRDFVRHTRTGHGFAALKDECNK